MKSNLRGPNSRGLQLPQIEVAAPCDARWEEMDGDRKVRLCHQCGHYVYNLSAMEPEEVVERIEQNEGKLCVRFYRRRDGTLLTRNCLIGVTRRIRRGEQRRDAAIVLAMTSVVVSLLMPTQGARASPAARIIAARSDAKTGNVERLRALLDFKVHVDSPTSSGVTLLMYAAREGHLEAVKLLLARGANVTLRDREGRTALDLARQEGHTKVVALLHKAGATE